MTEHIFPPAYHSRWNRALPPRLTIEPGDTVHFECLDSSGAQVHPDMTLPEYLEIDRGLIHALTGPVFVRAPNRATCSKSTFSRWHTRAGDGRASSKASDFSSTDSPIRISFSGNLRCEVSRSLAPAIVPLRPFCGVMGVAPAEDGEFRTRPPGIFGGNMDVRELCSRRHALSPRSKHRRAFFRRRCHAAQGDGEVCINGIECPVEPPCAFTCTNGAHCRALVESAPHIKQDPGNRMDRIESATDATAAAHAATSRMIDCSWTAGVFATSTPICSAALRCI